MASQHCRLQKLRVKSGASTIQNPQILQIIKVSPTTTTVIMVLRDTCGGEKGGRKKPKWSKLQYLYPVLEGGEGLSPSGYLGKASAAKDGFFTKGSENLQ